MSQQLNTIVFFVVNCLLISITSAQESHLTEVSSFGQNPGNLKMFIYVPNGLEEKDEIPLVVALHGCSQKAKDIAEESGWKKLADQHGFIVMYPQQQILNNPSLCFNWFRKADLDSEKGETASIKSMIEYTQKNYAIDSSEIFIYGLSAGAALSVSVMANFPEMINGGAIFGGAPYKVATNSFQAAKAMLSPITKTAEEWGKKLPQLTSNFPKLIVCHGTNDFVVDCQNGTELIKQWSFAHGIDAQPSLTDSLFTGHPIVNRYAYCKGEEEAIVHYEFMGVGHVLLIEPGEEVNQGGKTGIFAKDKGFHSTYYVAKDFGLLIEKP